MADNNSRLIVVSGLSGSGKSIALNALEDAGFYCMDNLPVSLFETLAKQICDNSSETGNLTAVGIDARSQGLAMVKIPKMIKKLKEHDIDTEVIFLDADDDILVKRFSETRRRHPLTGDEHPLNTAIEMERQLLEPLSSTADITIDTSHTSVHDLRYRVGEHIADRAKGDMAILITSFGFKRGLPRNADFVFDARCLPNPHWEPGLRALTGKDQPVIDFLRPDLKVQAMKSQIIDFLEKWIPCFEAEGRTYLTIAIGCTGGQHRSVFLTEQITQHLEEQGIKVNKAHREMS